MMIDVESLFDGLFKSKDTTSGLEQFRVMQLPEQQENRIHIRLKIYMGELDTLEKKDCH